ncbi:NADP-dependent 3-hydroxy acid dehydrogenase YdfG [Modicisalibacter ilicicola DSM 19980]|uniref:NADP-dependent 3-hydroxy acid dehydrogenase YdfG n=1 Tax=Modicisalibacter ilicicola DSM 19980 TaxID=1121942 RepID=A0A1M5BYH2_9GAMM|nr:SDR family NAD(P)-dependent oxidoreductase [Halomonas ilicicola]SHF47282.1 NADP-dependent 3-hydroxy acid dehydrogenase YdfG [Halomonas ilicicola DSM 19980]
MNKVCAVVGIGPGNGLALVRRFTREGYQVAMLSRDVDRLEVLEGEYPGAYAYRYDATDGERAGEVFARIRERLGPISVLLYNAGAGVFKSAEEASLQEFEDTWRVNCYGLAATTQAVLDQLREHDQASLVVIGASAALRGRAGTAPFASAKAAQRSLAQSLARQLGPENIHVAYVVIDGVVDLPRTRRAMPDKSDDFFLDADAIADSVWFLTRQQRSAWTFELDLRPFGESW